MNAVVDARALTRSPRWIRWASRKHACEAEIQISWKHTTSSVQRDIANFSFNKQVAGEQYDSLISLRDQSSAVTALGRKDR
jgi:hypothetical protein